MDKFKQIGKLLREGEVTSVEIEYDDENYTDLTVFLSLNKDICFDGLSLLLCNQTI